MKTRFWRHSVVLALFLCSILGVQAQSSSFKESLTGPVEVKGQHMLAILPVNLLLGRGTGVLYLKDLSSGKLRLQGNYNQNRSVNPTASNGCFEDYNLHQGSQTGNLLIGIQREKALGDRMQVYTSPALGISGKRTWESYSRDYTASCDSLGLSQEDYTEGTKSVTLSARLIAGLRYQISPRISVAAEFTPLLLANSWERQSTENQSYDLNGESTLQITREPNSRLLRASFATNAYLWLGFHF